MNGKSGI